MHDRFPSTFPSGQGSDLAGVVTELGEGVTDFSIGDKVLGFSWQRSSHATHVVVPTSQLILKPDALSWEVAGSLYVVACTAWAAVDAVAPKPGETVQLLAVRGAHVLGIASPANADWLTAKGATPVPYGDRLAEALTAAAPGGIDAFIDLFGPEYVQLAADLGISRDRIETIISFQKAQELGTRSAGSVDASTREVLTEMADLVASGRIEIPIAAAYPLDRVRDAFAELEQRHTRGKIVLIP
jgi:NADPH:quinone reductase-like Zn-dependent oxidoreductase